MRMPALFALATLFASSLLAAGARHAAAADALYYSDVATGSIVRTTRAGTNPQVFPVGNGISDASLSAFTVDRTTGDLYFTFTQHFEVGGVPPFALYRADAAGNGRTKLYAPPTEFSSDFPFRPISLEINPARDKIYLGSGESFHVFRSNLDGSDFEQAVTGIGNDLYVIDMAFDPRSGDFYWAQSYGDDGPAGILRQRAGASGYDVLTTPGAAGLALDLAAGHMYFADGETSIRRANLDGSNEIELIAGLHRPFKMQLDVAAGHMYWMESYTVGSRIRRANLDGTGIVDVVTGISATDFYLDVAPVPEPSSIWIAGAAVFAIGTVLGIRRRLVSSSSAATNDSDEQWRR